jgi:HipA-like C-terminal domain
MPSEFPLADALRSLLAQAPSMSSAALQAATGMSQASVSMALGQLGAAVHKLGAARSTRYALTQPILGLPAQQALHWCDPLANSTLFGQLTLLHSGDVHVRGPSGGQWLAQRALPWFLSSLRPQGFLGRQYTHLRPDFPADPDLWSVPQVLYIAANHITDPPAAFVLGSMSPTSSTAPAIPANDPAALAARYDQLAARSGQNLPAGSSAGGEQPKFVTRTAGSAPGHVIVKFSPPRGTPFGERWHSLLHLEHLANEVLRENGVAAAHTRIVQSPQRTYLQSERFDRVGTGGKRHVVAASAVHEAFVTSPRLQWTDTCEALVKHKLLSASDAHTIALSYWFGKFIGNTDMHFGNLSFFVDDVVNPVFTPTPVYDMLPMMWRPDIHQGNLDPSPLREPVIPAGFAAEAALARTWAIEYWQKASTNTELSTELLELCLENVLRVTQGFH